MLRPYALVQSGEVTYRLLWKFDTNSNARWLRAPMPWYILIFCCGETDNLAYNSAEIRLLYWRLIMLNCLISKRLVGNGDVVWLCKWYISFNNLDCADCELEWGDWGNCVDGVRTRSEYIKQQRIGSGRECNTPDVERQGKNILCCWQNKSAVIDAFRVANYWTNYFSNAWLWQVGGIHFPIVSGISRYPWLYSHISSLYN